MNTNFDYELTMDDTNDDHSDIPLLATTAVLTKLLKKKGIIGTKGGYKWYRQRRRQIKSKK